MRRGGGVLREAYYAGQDYMGQHYSGPGYAWGSVRLGSVTQTVGLRRCSAWQAQFRQPRQTRAQPQSRKEEEEEEADKGLKK